MIVTVPSADTLDLTNYGRVVQVSGTTTINTLAGVPDGALVCLVPTGAWAFGGAGNVVASTVAQVANEPVFLAMHDGVARQVGVRPTSPTLTTPTIADFTNAAHDHQGAAGGGQLTSAIFGASDKTGTGDVVLAEAPTINELRITGYVRLPGPVYQYAGSGTPEGAVSAPVGSTYHRTNGGAGTSFYVKETGSGDTGWVGK